MLASAMTPVSGVAIPAEHLVRFYDSDARLIDEVAEFLDQALRVGGQAVVIATENHRSELARKLGGLGPIRASNSGWHSGRLIMLDAAELLESFMVGLQPDRNRFESVLNPILDDAPAGQPLHAFGEMVAVLCERGNYDGALALEGLWNELVTRRRFHLFCGYPWRLFSSNEQGLAFQHVCAAHGQVLSPIGEGVVNPATTLAELEQQKLALNTEVQRRREAEQVLRHRERELADFLDNASEGIHKVAGDGTILYANRAELEMLGYRRDEYVGHNITDFYQDRWQIDSILGRLKRGEVLRDEPVFLRCKDGSRKFALICSNCYFEEGELIYTRCFTRDASDRLAREQALEQRNNVILQAPLGAALLIGDELRFELANDAFCRMLRRTDLVGKAFSQALPEMIGTRAERALRRVLETGHPFTIDEYPVILDAGIPASTSFYKVSLQPLRTPAGDVHGIVAVTADVTEQVRARQNLERSGAEREQLLASLHAANRTKDEFLAMLGHELRNPLSPIVTALQLMRMRGETGTAREQAIIQRQVEHLGRLVDDLLDVSRITRGQIELKLECCEISAILTKAVEQASTLLEQKSHKLRIDAESPLYCECDPVRLAQVVSNLLTNAARYTPQSGEIRLRAWRESNGRLAISVRDNGRGMAPETLAKVFELFYQDDRGVQRAEGGLGIGLAIVRSLVTLHGGTVEAHSEGPGKGSEFVIRLVALEKPGGRPATSVAQHPSVKGERGRRILLVDDNVDAVEAMGELLRAYGHTVSIFTDPASAVLDLPSLRPELAVLDIGLPVMDGYELATKVREVCGESCSLVALTGYGQESDKIRAQASGFDFHLVKPISHDRLLGILRALQ